MVMTYKEAINKYGSPYMLSKAVDSGALYKLEEGFYSTNKYEPELDVIMKKYPKAILTGEYAYYLHGLTDVIPEKYDLATPYKSAKLRDSRIRQIYMRDDLLDLGVEEKETDSGLARVYDKERMLIELLRNKNTMPYDLYKEVLLNYREIIGDLQIWRIQEYAERFPKSKMIKKALGEEVF